MGGCFLAPANAGKEVKFSALVPPPSPFPSPFKSPKAFAPTLGTEPSIVSQPKSSLKKDLKLIYIEIQMRITTESITLKVHLCLKSLRNIACQLQQGTETLLSRLVNLANWCF